MKLTILLLLVLAVSSLSGQQSAPWVPLAYSQSPPDNPLKGFMPYNGTYATFPYSMEYTYIAWKDIQSDYTTFTWKAVDDFLTEVAGRGHHAVFRVYADYPKKVYAVPQFLDSIPKHAYTDYSNTTSFSPDYDNPNLKQAMMNTIAAMGSRYDSDSRIGFIEVGFLGFWGEWHTYPHNDWFASTATQNAILDAFTSAFQKTRILVREPKTGTNMATRAIGYHDDSFCYSTYGSVATASWYFCPKIIAAGEGGKWKSQPIGGELRPEIQLSLWTDSCVCTNGENSLSMQSFPVCVDSTHASWLLAGNVFTPGNSGVEHARAVAGARRLGYDLYVSSVALPEIVESDTLSFAIKMRNMGVAPFYYRWAVQLRLVNDARIETQTWDTPWDLTTLVDTSEMEFSCPRRLDGLTPGYYTLLMRAADPLPGGKPLAFANTNWGRDVPGWLSLGGFTFASTTGNARGDDNGPPNNFKLEQNFPNPFNPATKIRFVIGVRGDGHRAMGNRWVRLVIYDVLGRTVAVLVDEAKEPGNFEVQFDGSRLAGGVYVCRMQAGDYVASRKILLLR